MVIIVPWTVATVNTMNHVLWIQGTAPLDARKAGLGHTAKNALMGFTTSVATAYVVLVLMTKLVKNMKGIV